MNKRHVERLAVGAALGSKPELLHLVAVVVAALNRELNEQLQARACDHPRV